MFVFITQIYTFFNTNVYINIIKKIFIIYKNKIKKYRKNIQHTIVFITS